MAKKPTSMPNNIRNPEGVPESKLLLGYVFPTNGQYQAMKGKHGGSHFKIFEWRGQNGELPPFDWKAATAELDDSKTYCVHPNLKRKGA